MNSRPSFEEYQIQYASSFVEYLRKAQLQPRHQDPYIQAQLNKILNQRTQKLEDYDNHHIYPGPTQKLIYEKILSLEEEIEIIKSRVKELTGNELTEVELNPINKKQLSKFQKIKKAYQKIKIIYQSHPELFIREDNTDQFIPPEIMVAIKQAEVKEYEQELKTLTKKAQSQTMSRVRKTAAEEAEKAMALLSKQALQAQSQFQILQSDTVEQGISGMSQPSQAFETPDDMGIAMALNDWNQNYNLNYPSSGSHFFPDSPQSPTYLDEEIPRCNFG